MNACGNALLLCAYQISLANIQRVNLSDNLKWRSCCYKLTPYVHNFTKTQKTENANEKTQLTIRVEY